MRARYYNPDIKRFINQDIKVGDIGSSQSLNRYAYCEGNPVSLIDPFGLSPQGTNGIWDILGAILSELTIHDLLGAAGFIPVLGVVADVADTVIYYCEGHPVEGTISLLCAIPGLGDAFGISIRGSKIVKTGKRIANLLIDAGKNTRTAAKVADAAKAAKNLVKFAGGKAGDFAHAAGNMIVKGFKAGASKLDDAANLLRHQGDKLYTSAKNAVKKLKGGSVDDIIVDGVGKKILNVGAGEFAIPCAINIDTNPKVSGVIFGDVYNLSQFTTGEFDHIISMNPFAYDLLESDVLRVLKEGGRMTITGNLSNIHFRRIYRASAEKLKKYGLEIVSTGRVQEIFMKYGGKISDGSRRVGGEILQIVLRKTGGI